MNYPDHIDLEFLATDRLGNIAVFTTGGEGPIPLSGYNEFRTEKFVDELWELPKRSGFKLLVDLPRPDDFIKFSTKGLFAYDFCDCHRAKEKTNKYEIQSKPTKPLKLSELPNALQSIVLEIKLPLEFDLEDQIQIDYFIPCLSKI